MISTNQEKLLKFLDGDNIEAHPVKNIEEEDTEQVNRHGHHDHLQALFLITAIPLIAIDNKKEDEDEDKCKDNEGSRQNDRCTTSSDSAGSSLTSHDLFLSQVKVGLILGIFFVWPAIRIFLLNLLTKCEPNLFFVEDIKKHQDQPEIPNWLTAFVYYVPVCTSGAWHTIFMFESLLANCMTLFMHLKSYLRKTGCLCNSGKLYGIMYSPMVTNMVSFFVQVTMKSSNAENLSVELWLLVAILLSSLAILLAIVGFAASKFVQVTAANGAVDGLDLLIAYPICVTGLGLYMFFM